MPNKASNSSKPKPKTKKAASSSKKKNRSKKSTKRFDPSETYSMSTNEASVENLGVMNTFQMWLNDRLHPVSRKAEERKKLKDLGLHGDFDPSATYKVESQKQAINNWKEFMLVYFVMALSIAAFISILVHFEQLENPFDRFLYPARFQNDAIVTTPRAVEKFNSKPNLEAERVLEVYGLEAGSVVEGRVILNGIATAFFDKVEGVLLDEDGNELGKAIGSLRGEERDNRAWGMVLNMHASPATTGGKVAVYPISEGVESESVVNIPIKFAQTVKDSARMYAPVPLQLVNNREVTVWAEVGNSVDEVDVRILNEAGEQKVAQKIAVENGVVRGSVKVPNIFGIDGSQGSFKIFSGGVEILSVPVRFQEA